MGVKAAIDLIEANETSRHFDPETSQALTEVINNLKRAKRHTYMEQGHCSVSTCNKEPKDVKKGKGHYKCPDHPEAKWIMGNCEVDTCSAVGEYKDKKILCPTHPDKKWKKENSFSVKRFFKGLLNVAAIVFAVVSIIVEPGCAPVAIAAIMGCCQSLWDLGEDDLASGWTWMRPNKKTKTTATPSDVMRSLEQALASIEFKMNHVRMHKDFEEGLQGLRNVFKEHETKFKILNLTDRTKYKELRCKTCNGTGNYNADEEISKPCTDESIKCGRCDGTGLGVGAEDGQKVYLKDYPVVLQTNWNIKQAKREIRDVLHELNSRQKKLAEKMECIDDLVQKKVLETLMKLSKADPDALPVTKTTILNVAMDDGAEWYKEFCEENDSSEDGEGKPANK